MLRQLRSKRTMKIVMWILAVVFVVGFLFLGQGLNVGSSQEQQSNVAAVVNGVEVPYETYSTRVTQMAEAERTRTNREELGSSDYERIESQVWDGIVAEILVQQEAKKLGLHAADNEIVSYLENNPPPFVRQSFVDETGNFDAAAFRRALDDPGTNWGPAEEYVRSLLPTLKLQQMVAARATVSEAEVREEFVRRALHQTVRYIGRRWIDVPADPTPPSDDELRRFHQEHEDLFARGEQVQVEALRIAKKPSAEDQEELRRDAMKILDELTRGVTTDFGALAEIYSEDPSATQRGALGWVRRGSLPPIVDTAVWDLPVGGRTAPLIADTGLYIAQVDSARTARDGQREIFVRQLVLKLEPSATTQDSLRALAFRVAGDAKRDFAGAARKHGLTPQTLQPITASTYIPDFGFSQRLHDWAFAAKAGDVGGPFGNDDAILIVHVVEKQPKGLEPFDTVRDRVVNAFQEDRRKQAVRTVLDAVLQDVRSGRSLDDAARSRGLEVHTPEPFAFYGSVPDVGGANEFTAVATTLPVGQTSGVVETSQGAFVLQVLSREPFDEAKYQSERETYSRTLLDRRASELMQAWLAELRAAANIEDRRGPRV